MRPACIDAWVASRTAGKLGGAGFAQRRAPGFTLAQTWEARRATQHSATAAQGEAQMRVRRLACGTSW